MTEFPDEWKIKTRAGWMYVAPKDAVIGDALKRYGQWAWSEVELLREVTGSGIFVDVGANIGTHAMALASSASRVIAYEPQKDFARLVQASAAANSFRNVEVRQCAVGAAAGEVAIQSVDLLTDGHVNWGAMRISEGGDFKVRQVRLDDDLDGVEVTALKIDVETMEPLVVRGARELLKRARPYVYAEVLDPLGAWAMWNEFDGLEYTLFLHRCPHFDPKNERGNPQNIYGDGFDVMMLAVPRGRKVPSFPLIEVENELDLMRKVIGGGSEQMDLTDKLRQLSAQLHDGVRMREFRGQVDALLKSTSWRLTEPLRRAVRLMKGRTR